ncbi:Protein CBG09039 [Caenorhabditis briggsae]|uniref:Protein CBG09039 n=1 Tax=Caenorhabditis briggsae TaxID=6238 RepID=A8X7Y6_CAEBR|nr:Protein CBG09039 [Caenorhabditis briggsae]CAP28747.2 Protein CBG09039 [Caenorhabditis briggsae]
MPNRVKYYEKLREKRRLARERAKKTQEERKRAREVKEEKWTTRNEFELISDHRQIQRKAYIAKIRKESQEMLEMAVARVKSHEEREDMIEKEIKEEVETIRNFINEVSDLEVNFYNFEILQQCEYEKKIDFDLKKQDLQIEKLKNRVEEETLRNTEYAESLKYIKEMIRIKKAEKEEKKKKLRMEKLGKK